MYRVSYVNMYHVSAQGVDECIKNILLLKGPHTLHCFLVYAHKGPTYFTLFLRVCSQRAHILYIVSWCMFTKGPHTLHCFYVYVHKGPTLLGSNFICPWPCQVRYLLPASMTAGRR